jgi:hypothetical protein
MLHGAFPLVVSGFSKLSIRKNCRTMMIVNNDVDPSHRGAIRRNIVADLPRRANQQKPVQPSYKKYSAFAVGQISDLTPRVSPDKRGGSRSSRNVW